MLIWPDCVLGLFDSILGNCAFLSTSGACAFGLLNYVDSISVSCTKLVYFCWELSGSCLLLVGIG